jgi:hypothetical protein
MVRVEIVNCPEGENPPPLGCCGLGPLVETVQVEVLGRAEDVADAADPLRAEAVAGRERNLLLDGRGRGRIGLGDRRDRRVPHR